MPIGSPSSSSNSILTGSKIKDTAVRLFSNIQSRFEPRNAVKYKLHHFEKIILTEPTFCSQCNSFIWGLVGISCKLCKLTCHPECVDKVFSKCSKAGEIARLSRVDVPHKFKKEFFILPTYCDHCGNFVTNIFKPEASRCNPKEGGCGFVVHESCIDKVSHHCLRTDNLNQKSPPRISIEDFNLLSELGRGTTSKVYLAKHKVQGGEFAIKVIKKTNECLRCDPEIALTEMEVLKEVKNFPFLTKINCCFQSSTSLFFVMEYIKGQNLLYHIEIDKKFSEDRARFYGAEIVLALNHLHTLNVIYRDLKPENVILDTEGHCKLVDFGLSKNLKNGKDMRTRTFCGTPWYISPEMIKIKRAYTSNETDYGFSVDWWAFGVLMLEMLTGIPPFPDAANDEDLFRRIFEDEVEIPETLSLHARTLLGALLIKDPKERLGSRSSDCYEQGIFNHPFFMFGPDGLKVHKWSEIRDKKLEPPKIPLKDKNLSNYPTKDEKEPILTPVDSNKLDNSNTDYLGFSFYSESLLPIVRADLTE